MGTRPEIIKMMPLHTALNAAGFQADVLHTGQHSGMAEDLYQHFGVKPVQDLKLSRDRNDLAHLSARLLESIDRALDDMRPDAVLVHGDTSSTLNAALAAFYRRIPVGHIEAGLRTFTFYDPFPEEKNRQLVGRLAVWHFAPTAGAAHNLRSEAIDPESIFEVGNTVVDALQQESRRQATLPGGGAALLPPAIRAWPKNARYVLLTAHRRENWGQPLTDIAHALLDILQRHPDLHAVWPVHPNPQVSKTVQDALAVHGASEARTRLLICDPLDYPALVAVLKGAWLVMTDSGGLQEEAAAMNIPLLVLRRTTERPEVVQSGGGRLIGVERSAIVCALNDLIESPAQIQAMREAINPFGDGQTSTRVAAILRRQLAS